MKSSGASAFVSYSHADKPFVQRLAADLKVSGVEVWIDEAELRVGDSLIEKISNAIQKADYLLAVLSRTSVSSRWVREELEQALHGQIDGNNIRVLPIVLTDCDIPGFLLGKIYADFRDKDNYEASLESLLHAIGVKQIGTVGALLLDPLAERYNRITGFYARPRVWYCINCSAQVSEKWNYPSPICPKCNTQRPYMDADTTIAQCEKCRALNVSGATYCEWYGAKMPRD